MTQLDDWLEKAAMLALNNPKHGWEPVRRDQIDDIVSADAAGLRALATDSGGWSMFRAVYLLACSQQSNFYRIDLDLTSRFTLTASAVQSMSRRKLNDSEWVGSSLGFVAWPGKQPNGQLFLTDHYLPETVTSVSSLYDCAHAYGCGAALQAFLDLLARRIGISNFSYPMPVTIMLLARRPFNLIGAESPLELCSYVIEIQSADDIKPTSQAPVRLAAHRDTVSIPVLRRASGDKPATPLPAWALLGCGSLGSKIALHLGRSGHAPSAVVDQDTFEPHNFARHACLPMSADIEGFFFRAKSSAVADDLARLGQRPESYRQDIIGMLEHEAGRSALVSGSGAFVVNTTASSLVREILSSTKWNGLCRPRTIETSLFGGGSVAYLACEGHDGNPNCSDLVTEFYRHAQQNETLRRAIFDAKTEEIAIGQGCSAITFAMSDAQLSMLAAPLAMQVRKSIGDAAASPGGQLSVGTLDSKELNLIWSRLSVAPWIVLSQERVEAPAVRISPRVHQTIKTTIKQIPGRETGGVLVGRFSHSSNTFHIVDVMTAPPDSVFSAEKFVLGIQGLSLQLQRLIERSGGTLYAVGTWHNHLVTSGPSMLDVRTAALLAIHQLFPLLMLIHTPGGYRYLTAEVAARTEKASNKSSDGRSSS